MLQKCSISKTIEIFFISPTKEHYLMDISKQAKLAHTSIKKNLETLKKEDLITESIDKKGERDFPLYKANLNSTFKKYKIIYNLNSMFESKLIEFIEKTLTPKSIVLFGSYSRGEDTEDSDIDLFVECKQEKIELKEFEKKLNRKIEIHFNENFKEYPKELKNNIINGMVLNGFLEGYE